MRTGSSDPGGVCARQSRWGRGKMGCAERSNGSRVKRQAESASEHERRKGSTRQLATKGNDNTEAQGEANKAGHHARDIRRLAAGEVGRNVWREGGRRMKEKKMEAMVWTRTPTRVHPAQTAHSRHLGGDNFGREAKPLLIILESQDRVTTGACPRRQQARARYQRWHPPRREHRPRWRAWGRTPSHSLARARRGRQRWPGRNASHGSQCGWA